MKSRHRSLLTGCRPKNNLGVRLTLALPALLLAADALAGWIGDTRPMMGTEVRVYLWSEDVEAGREVVDAVFAEAERINGLMSTYLDDSEVSEVNRLAAEQPVAVAPELFKLIQQSLDMSVLTRGAFDITFESVGQLYDYRSGRRPDAEALESARALIDYRYVHLDDATGTVTFLKEGVRINLGGIANGYVVERGIDILRVNDVKHAIVTAGGDTRLLGDRRGRPWMVGIRDPSDDEEIALSVPLVDEAISTSGDHERFFIEDGVRYHHIIEPESGQVAGAVRSATVFGPNAVITDALSTAVFVMGVEQGLTLISTLPDYESIVIDAEGSVYYSDGLTRPSPVPNGQ